MYYDDDDQHGKLTPRELEVLALLRKGLRNKDIARALYITEPVVEKHLSKIYRKLGVASRVQAASHDPQG